MNAKGVMPMDSYRLAQYTVQVPCFVCDGGNNFDAELCRHCQAPMALSHQAQARKTAPQMIATLGSADAGKTVYLGMLMDMLSRKNDELQVLARGAFSVSLQQTTMASLAQCEFPAKTPNEPDRWNWVHSQVKAARRRTPFELIMPDVSGEAVIEEIQHPNAYPVIRQFLSRCSGIMLLIDAARLQQGEQDQDFFAVKILTYLAELQDQQGSWAHKPVAIIFTKADQCEKCFWDPCQFAERHAPNLFQHCAERFDVHSFFAVGVAGAVGFKLDLGGRQQVPLRIEPRGIIEPFAWLVENIGRPDKFRAR